MVTSLPEKISSASSNAQLSGKAGPPLPFQNTERPQRTFQGSPEGSSTFSTMSRPKLPLEIRRVVQRVVRFLVFASLAFLVVYSVFDGLRNLWENRGILDVTRRFGFGSARILL